MSDGQKKHIALLVAYGPEVKAFVHSGLAERLSKDYKVTIIARLPHSAVFAGLEYCDVVQMPAGEEARLLGKLRSWGLRTQVQWLQKRGRKHWVHYLPKNGATPSGGAMSSLSSAIKGNRLVARSVSVIERSWGRAFGSHDAWRTFLLARNIDCLITSAFSGTYVLPALQTASNLGIQTVVATNSWKDVYTTTKVAVVPTRLIVWTDQAARDVCEMNPHLDRNRVRVAETLHLQLFHNPPPLMSREELCTSLGLDPGRPYICYSAAAPTAVLNEELIVEAILRVLNQGDPGRNAQLLLRMNPMEDGSRWKPVQERHPELVLQKPRWEWIREVDWCCALREDVSVWLAMVHHAAGNISIASTVTLEFAAFGRPVLNVCFDLPSSQPERLSNRRFWDADFYRDIRDHNLASPIFRQEELQELLVQLLSKKNGNAPAGGKLQHSPVEQVAEIIHGIV
jgi:hypothetical protein